MFFKKSPKTTFDLLKVTQKFPFPQVQCCINPKNAMSSSAGQE